MLKTKSKILLALFLILVMVSSYCFATVEPRTAETATDESVSAISETEGEAVTTSEEEQPISEESITSSWTNSDLTICQDKVEVSNVIDGNAFIIGNEVTITGEIGGDLFVIADKLNIDGGYVYSNLFVCANEITLNGVIYDVYAICNTFNLESNGFIYRDMKVIGSNINILGKVRRNAIISANSIAFPESTETVETSIYGNLDYSSISEINIPEGAVAGTTTYNQSNNTDESVSTGSIILSYVLDLLKVLVYTLIVTLILLRVAPNFIEKVSKMKIGKSFASLGIGLAALVAFFVFIFIGIFLLISVVGSPVFAIGMFASMLIAYIGNAVTSIFLGKLFTRLLKMESKPKFVLFTLVSALIIWAISLIPYAGSILSFLIWLFGIGALIVNIFNKKEKVKETTEVTE